jgi:two-component system, OmpR family, sensor histidine kinase ArlS
MKKTIKTKFISLSISIILPMFALMVFVVVFSIDHYNLQNVKKTALNDSYLIQIYLSQYFAENSPENLSEREIYFLNYDLSKLVGLRTQLFFLRGHVYVDSGKETLKRDTDLFLQTKEAGLALANKKNFVIKHLTGHRFFMMSFPFYQNKKLIGVMRFEYPLKEEDQFRVNLSMILSLISFLVSIIFILLLYIFTQRIVSPLATLKTRVLNFTGGKLQETLKIQSGDEVEELADAFNKMANNITSLLQSLQDEKTKQQEFFNNMTHEIRTPLTTIIGYADIIEKLDNKAERNDCLQYIQTEGKRLLRLVNDLFRLSKLNKYTLTLNKVPCNLEKILQETAEIVRYKANKYGIAINTSVNANVKLKADKDKLKEVLLNLFDNAILHSKSPQIDIVLSSDGEEAVLAVTDYGQGIDAKQMEKIQSKIFGCHMNSIYDQAGHGYGLPVSKSIVEAHGGRLEIDSIVGKGTTVRVRLPINNER